MRGKDVFLLRYLAILILPCPTSFGIQAFYTTLQKHKGQIKVQIILQEYNL